MIKTSAAPQLPTFGEEQAGAGQPLGAPCVFKGCSGFFHAASGPVGVVLCSPWGFEDLAMRKSWRLLAEAVARAGFPCLRFDYPGTGNSLGAMEAVTEAATWTRAVGDAADFLRAYSGVKRFVLIGQSLGALLAAEAAAARADVAALLLIAPAVKGRAYLRELALTARMVDEKIGVKQDVVPGGGLGLLGFSLSPAMVCSLERLDLTKAGAGGLASVVVYDREDRRQGAEVSEHYRRLGIAARLDLVAPYHLLVSDATTIQPLPVTPEQIAATLLDLYPTIPALAPPRIPLLPATLRAEAFREEPVAFGPASGLRGTWCQPARGAADGLAFVFLNRGLNAQIGWRRMSVDHARALAARGAASLRFDFGGLGESPDSLERPAPLIYSDLLAADVRAAVDVLVARGATRVALVGVCSGAFAALAAAAADPRVSDLVVVNAQRLVWNPAESVEDVVRYGLRSMGDYLGDVRSRGALRKLLRSRRRVVPALWFLLKRRFADALKARLPLELRAVLLRDRMAGRVTRLFADLAGRGTRVALLYSDNDPGLRELAQYYGARGRGLRLPGVAVSVIPGADHNLTSARAADWLLDQLIGLGATEPERAEAEGPGALASRGGLRQACAAP